LVEGEFPLFLRHSMIVGNLNGIGDFLLQSISGIDDA
jgi:hypothetical protein